MATHQDKGIMAEQRETYDATENGSKSEVVAPKPTFGQKAKRHCARWWWVHLLIFCIIFLIISLCLVYVAMPKIAQKGVDDSYLEFTDVQFLNPTSNSITLTQRAILHSPSMYTPTLDPFNASLYLVTNGTIGATPMLMPMMPMIHALHPQSDASLENQVLPFVSLDEVTRYATQVLSNENVTTVLIGKTKLHEGKLPVLNVNTRQQTTYKTLNGLKGFNVTGVSINATASPGDPNFKGSAFVPNPSVLTIALGNVTLNVATASAGYLGTAIIQDMTIRPGGNHFPMTATLNQTRVLTSLVNGVVTLLITGNSSVYEGQHLTYYEKALASNQLSLSLNVLDILAGHGP